MDFKKHLSNWNKKSKKQKAFIVCGSLFLLLTLIGVVFPILPQVPFAIISAYFFSKGSSSVHRWIRNNKYMGEPVRDWEDHRVVRTKLKITSVVFMLAGAALAHWRLDPPWPYIIDGSFILATIFLLTRKSHQ